MAVYLSFKDFFGSLLGGAKPSNVRLLPTVPLRPSSAPRDAARVITVHLRHVRMLFVCSIALSSGELWIMRMSAKCTPFPTSAVCTTQDSDGADGVWNSFKDVMAIYQNKGPSVRPGRLQHRLSVYRSTMCSPPCANALPPTSNMKTRTHDLSQQPCIGVAGGRWPQEHCCQRESRRQRSGHA